MFLDILNLRIENKKIKFRKNCFANDLDTLTNDEMFSGQCFAILAMFFYPRVSVVGSIPHAPVWNTGNDRM